MSRPETELVSVLIACYNARRYVARTLESVLAQTYRPLEVIVVDDGSTDGSAEVIRRFEPMGVRLVRQANGGQSVALNAAIGMARGAYVQFLDADDLLHPEKIAAQQERLREQPGCIASAQWGRFYDDDPGSTRFEPENVWQDLDPQDWLALSRDGGADMMFPALWLVPMEVVQRAGPWRRGLSLGNDGEYFTRVVLASRGVRFCERARCYYRSGLTGSVSGRRSRAAWSSQYRVLELCEQYVLEREDSPRMRKAFSQSWQRFAHSGYPYVPALARRALVRARQLHDVVVEPDGGPMFRFLARTAGWRIARRLQVASGRP